MMRTIKRYWLKFRTWLYYNFPIYINLLNFYLPWKHWWKVRKYFLKPETKFYYCKGYGNLMVTGVPSKKIFLLQFAPLDYKTKFSDYCHEGDPYIVLGLFNKWYWVWTLTYPKKKTNAYNDYGHSSLYWECVLEKLYGRWDYTLRESKEMNIYEVYEDNIWKRYEKGNKETKFTCIPYLTKDGFRELMKCQYIGDDVNLTEF